MVFARRLTVLLSTAVLTLGIAAPVAASTGDTADEWRQQVPEGAVIETSAGVPVVLEEGVRTWFKGTARSFAAKGTSDKAIAEARAAYLTRDLSAAEKDLLRSGLPAVIDFDVPSQRYTAVKPKSALITPLAVVQNGTCSDNANNSSCLFRTSPYASIKFTGSSGEWWHPSPTGLAGCATFFSPRNMKGSIRTVAGPLGIYWTTLPADQGVNLSPPQACNAVRHGS